MGDYGFCRGILALAIVALLITPGVVAETPQVISVDSTVADTSWPATQPTGDAYSDLGYAETSQDWSLDTTTVAQNDQDAYWMAAEEPCSENIAQVEEAGSGSGLSIDVTLDWASKYMFRGFDVYDDSGAWQPSVEVGLWDTGITLGWWASYASSDRNQVLFYDYADEAKGEGPTIIGSTSRRDLDEHDYYAYYNCSPVDGVDMELGWIYYDFIHLDSYSDYHEPYGVITLSCLPLSPYFGAYYGFPKHDSVGGEGWNTTIGVSHSAELCQSFCGQGPMTLDLAADVWYNGGQYNVDTGWSHATFGGSLGIPLSEKLSFSPGVYYQLSMEDTINPEDEWWTVMSLSYSW